MVLVRLALLPFSFLYRAVTFTRNWLYDKGILSSTGFDIPIISVGNLSVGGTGKTPQVEYLIRALQNDYKLAILSRGYGRSSKGFVLGNSTSTAKEIGDEPLQYLLKYPQVNVAVCENRVKGAKELLMLKPEIEIIILDDAFQHRAIKPGLQILLTEYSNLFCDNYHLPSGTLRESSKGMKRADMIVVTKTPSILSPMERRRIESKLKPFSYQTIYYSWIKYGDFLPTWQVPGPQVIGKDFYFQRGYQILLFTGIANPSLLFTYLKDSGARVQLMRFPDHHNYNEADVERIRTEYESIKSSNKLILTTEKDMMRLKTEFGEFLKNYKVFYIPIESHFHENDDKNFKKQVNRFIADQRSV